ncbi:MAG: hypothetical protein ACJAUP_003803 [Cellvibrionaceae bacterium]|jgi:hypothetical protein
MHCADESNIIYRLHSELVAITSSISICTELIVIKPSLVMFYESTAPKYPLDNDSPRSNKHLPQTSPYLAAESWLIAGQSLKLSFYTNLRLLHNSLTFQHRSQQLVMKKVLL